MKTLRERELHEMIAPLDITQISKAFLDARRVDRKTSNLNPKFYFDGISMLNCETLNLYDIFNEVCVTDDEGILADLDPVRKEKFLLKLKGIREGKREDLEEVSLVKDYVPLIPTQPFANPAKIKDIIADGDYKDNPTAAVVKVLDKYYIIDGQHRFLAWLLNPDCQYPTRIYLLDIDKKI